MKKFYILLIALFTFNLINAQDWQLQNPMPTRNQLNNIKFIDSNIGYVVGNFGTILKTTDGGENWIKINSGTINH